MMSTSKRFRDLHSTLDRLIIEQKEDIRMYSRGHLNENKMKQDTNKALERTWNNNESMNFQASLPSRRLNDSETRKEKRMRNALISLSMPSYYVKSNVSVLPENKTEFNILKENGSMQKISFYQNSDKSSNVMTNKSADHNKQLSLNEYSNENERVHSTRNMSASKVKMPNINGITRAEQFKQVKNLETEIEVSPRGTGKLECDLTYTKKHDLLKKRQKHNEELNRELMTSNNVAFSAFIANSGLLASILENIQIEYENYITYLLDEHVDRHQVLERRIEILKDKHYTDATQIKQEEKILIQLEEQIRLQLAINERIERVKLLPPCREDVKLLLASGRASGIKKPASRLREDVQKAIKSFQVKEEIPEYEVVTKNEDVRMVVPKTRSEELEDLHDSIREKLEAVNQLKLKIKKDFVPVTECKFLTRCHREASAEIERIKSLIDFYGVRCEQLEQEINELIHNADITDREARSIWRRLLSMNAVSSLGEIGRKICEDLLNHPDDDESTKWNWYIS